MVAGLEGLLKEPERQSLVDHLKVCQTCRAEFKGLQTLRQRLVGDGKTLAQSSVEDEVMDRILREKNVRLKSAVQAGTGLGIRRLIMKSTVVKVAVAAAVVLACGAARFLWSGTDSGVALADVLAKVGQIRALTYQMDSRTKVTVPGMASMEMDMKMTWLIADDYGMRLDGTTADAKTGQVVAEHRVYLLPGQKTMLMLEPAKKQYARMVLDETLFQEKRKETNDPRMMIQQLLGCRYEDLGRKTLDGIEVQGFQSTDPALVGGKGDADVKVWVDTKTRLPVRVDAKMRMEGQMEMEYTIHDFQWDVAVRADEFAPVIPPDYKPSLADGAKAVAPTERGAIEGLRFCVEFTGEYPQALDLSGVMSIMQDFMKSETPVAKKYQQEVAQMKSQEEQLAKSMEISQPIQSLTMFYMTLSQQHKEPVYHGKVVQPGDVAQVLLRWKTGANEYRVIFADLHAETVNADTLAKLEAALPQ